MVHGGWWSFLSADDSKPRPSLDRNLLRRVFDYAKPHWRSVTIVMVTIIAISLMDLIPPLLYRDLIDHVLPDRNIARLNWLAAAMLGIPILSGLVSVVQRHYSARAGEGIIYDLRQEMYAHLQKYVAPVLHPHQRRRGHFALQQRRGRRTERHHRDHPEPGHQRRHARLDAGGHGDYRMAVGAALRGGGPALSAARRAASRASCAPSAVRRWSRTPR